MKYLFDLDFLYIASWANGYRLPTEEEYKKIAHDLSFVSDSKLLHYAWLEENSNGETHDVGLKLPNSFGLYDVFGNVREIVYIERFEEGTFKHYWKLLGGCALSKASTIDAEVFALKSEKEIRSSGIRLYRNAD